MTLFPRDIFGFILFLLAIFVGLTVLFFTPGCASHREVIPDQVTAPVQATLSQADAKAVLIREWANSQR